MDEQIIRTLQEQAIEERQYIQEKYGQDEDVVQVVNRRDYLTGRQSAAVRLYDNERNVPLHRHGYIELMYAYKGTFTHRFGEENIGINIIAVPEFFEKPFQMLKKQNKIMDFLVEMLRRNTRKPQYLIFHIKGRHALENLMENLIESIMEGNGASEEISQYTMGLLFLYLAEQMDREEHDPVENYKDEIIQETLKYIEIQYRTARLGKIAEDYHLALPSLSKLIKEGTGSTFQELLMKRRFEKAAVLLLETSLQVEEIALNVGYAHQSYFHRQFKMRYGVTPRRYRLIHRRKMRQQGKI